MLDDHGFMLINFVAFQEFDPFFRKYALQLFSSDFFSIVINLPDMAHSTTLASFIYYQSKC